MKIDIQKLSPGDIENKGIKSWPIWEKEVSQFDWHYDQTEECLLLEGQVTVETENGETVEFGAGDFVTFPQGMNCKWDITVPVRKHYNFK